MTPMVLISMAKQQQKDWQNACAKKNGFRILRWSVLERA